MLQTKSVHSSIDRSSDGLRILVARLRGRGLPKTACDVWMANLGPTEQLLRGFQSGKVSWEDFKRRYREELFEGGSVDRRNRLIKNHGQKFTLRLLQELAVRGPVTLLCHCPENEPHCHRHVLESVLRGRV